jgi:uncharacterized metal-binding protein YceD (DUF177 family)
MPEPFSRVVRVDAVPEEGHTVTIEAAPAEREALAALYKVPSIEALSATLSLKRSETGGVRVTGSVHGELTQICVVSLEPFAGAVDEDIDVRFAPRADRAPKRPSEKPESSMVDEDEPDLLVDGKIDLGALAAEFFALGLDPYPRKPGVTFESPRDLGAKLSPFSELASRPRRKPD